MGGFSGKSRPRKSPFWKLFLSMSICGALWSVVLQACEKNAHFAVKALYNSMSELSGVWEATRGQTSHVSVPFVAHKAKISNICYILLFYVFSYFFRQKTLILQVYVCCTKKFWTHLQVYLCSNLLSKLFKLVNEKKTFLNS